MLEKWLADNGVERITDVVDLQVLTESQDVDREALIGYLGKEILRNYVVPGELELVFEDLGVPEVAAHLSQHKFPSIVRVRNGDFGEAVAGALFRRVRRWCVPILKLRYKQRPNQPVQGADVLAFHLRSNPPVVAVPEVKTRTTRHLNLALDARAGLQQVLDDLPSSLQFVVARLLEQGNALAPRIAKLLVDDFDIERHIVLIHDDDRWDERITTRFTDEEDQPTMLTVVRINELSDVIGKAFLSAQQAPSRRNESEGVRGA